MLHVNFTDTLPEGGWLKFAVVVAQHHGKWVFCKHKARETLECPGGHWEQGEEIGQTARRELYEETGALDFALRPICIYAVQDDIGTKETFGMLFFADIFAFGPLPDESEMERIVLLEGLPPAWTYPAIQPRLLEKVIEAISR